MPKIAYHKQNKIDYTHYTLRLKTDVLDKIREIARENDISINECINQSLEFVINDYNSK